MTRRHFIKLCALLFSALSLPKTMLHRRFLPVVLNGGAAAPASTLGNDLVVLWKGGETSDGSAPVPRLDSVGSRTATEVGGNIPSRTGIVTGTQQVDFIAVNVDYLNRASDAGLQSGNNNFTWACCFILDDTTTVRGLLQKASAAGQYEWFLRFDGTGRLRASISSDGTALVNLFTTASQIVAGTQYVARIYHDADNDLWGVQLNENTKVQSLSYTAGVFAGTDGFRMGSNAVSGSNLDGGLCYIAKWSRILTDAEWTEYNSLLTGSDPFPL
jgi:hypothetical protein